MFHVRSISRTDLEDTAVIKLPNAGKSHGVHERRSYVLFKKGGEGVNENIKYKRSSVRKAKKYIYISKRVRVWLVNKS